MRLRDRALLCIVVLGAIGKAAVGGDYLRSVMPTGMRPIRRIGADVGVFNHCIHAIGNYSVNQSFHCVFGDWIHGVCGIRFKRGSNCLAWNDHCDAVGTCVAPLEGDVP